jgi:hypothetical protein
MTVLEPVRYDTKVRDFGILAALWLVVHLFIFSHNGIRWLHDAVGYLKAGDFLLSDGKLIDPYHAFYSAYIGTIALFRYFFPGSITGVLLFQSIMSLIATFSLYEVSKKIFNNRYSGLAAGILFLVWWDNIQWNLITMTESLFCSLVCIVLFVLNHYRGSKQDIFKLTTLLAILMLIRPTAVIIIAAVFVFMMKKHQGDFRSKPFLKWAILICFLGLALIGTFLLFYLWDFTEEYVKGNIVTYVDTLKSPDLNEQLRIQPSDLSLLKSNQHPLFKISSYIINNPVEFAKTATLKVFYLVSGYRPYFSLSHNLYTAMWLTFIYICFFAGILELKLAPISFFACSAIFFNCLLIGISTVDWDNRFYIPMEPGIVVVASGGVMRILQLFRNRSVDL